MAVRIALTFDDGPNTSITPQVLSVLEQYRIPASFFLIGQCITEESVPVIRREVAAGCTIECHSFTHSDMTKMTGVQIQDEVKQTNALIKKYAGTAPVFFRPPYISVNNLMYDSIDMPFICGRGVKDWLPEISAQKRADDVISGVCDGQIILLHDMPGNVNTVEALRSIIPVLQKKGVVFLTIRSLFDQCGVDPARPYKIWTDVFN